MAPVDESTPRAELEGVLARQRAAFLRDGPSSRQDRMADLKKLRSAVLSSRVALEAAVNQDFGHRSAHETALMELLGIIQGIDYYRRHLRRFMKPERRGVGAVYWPAKAFVEYQPLGVVGVMSPWNYPISLALNPLTAALAAGNRVMIKPSEATPHTNEVLSRMLSDCFPAEQVCVCTGGPETGKAFTALPLDRLLFTGSTQVGRSVMRSASDNLVPVTLELGGKSPAIIAPGKLTERNLDALVFGKLANAGQTCVAPDYLFVHEQDIGQFPARFGERVRAFYPAGTASCDYTAIINDRQHARLAALVEDARNKGARIEALLEGTEPAANKRAFAPALILEPTDDMQVMREEIFGPILPVMSYRDIDDVIGYINARPRPLALYYLGGADAQCAALRARTTSGAFGLDNTLLHAGQDDLPFGGVGASGMGAYHGVEGFRTMSHAKAVFIQPRVSLLSWLHAPFGRLVDSALAIAMR